MKAADLCRREVVSLPASANVREAADAMRREHVGALVVTDPAEPGRIVGMLTDRDLVIDVLAAARDPARLAIADVCRTDLAGVSDTATLREVIEAMHTAAVRRLLVMRADGSLAGVLSIDDVVDAFALEFEALAGVLHGGMARELDRTRPHEQAAPALKPALPAYYLPTHEP